MGQRVMVVLCVVAIVAACGHSEGTNTSQTPGGSSSTGGSSTGGEPSSGSGGTKPATSGGDTSSFGGKASPTGGQSSSAGRTSSFGGLENSTTGGTSESTGGSEPTGAAGAPSPSECPEPAAPSPDPDDAGTYIGSLDITLGLESQLGTYSTIEGNLTIGPSAPPSGAKVEAIDLSHLRVVEGDLLIRNTGLTTIELPRLERVGGQLWSSLNLNLKQVRVPELRSVGSLYLDANLELLDSQFPKLGMITDTLYIHRNVKLVSWGLDAVQAVENITITANPALPTCLVDALNAATGKMASSEATGSDEPVICDCSGECGRITVDCQ